MSSVIIAALFYYECKDVNPCMSGETPGTKKQHLEAGSESVALSADKAQARALRDAFWKTFAEKVMQHLVHPAVLKGIIRVAPKAYKENPAWWVESILPVLNDPAVWTLYWLGGKRMAKHSWYHVCEVLATYEFPSVFNPEPFIQKTVPEFLAAAGYRQAPAHEDVAAPSLFVAAKSKAASSASSGSARTSVPGRGAAPAASVVNGRAGVGDDIAPLLATSALPCQNRIEQVRQQSDFARRFAYSELDQLARETIASAQWCWLSDREVCSRIGRSFTV